MTRMDARATVVTAADERFAWGAFLLAASMRRNGMRAPLVVGAVGWRDTWKRRVAALPDVTVVDLPGDRRCVTCQKPMMLLRDEVTTPWVVWADSDAVFVGDCTEWLAGTDPDAIVVRPYDPPPPDVTPANLAVWRRDVARFRGAACETPRLVTRVNGAFVVLPTARRDFARAWQDQIEKVLPPDVEIIMAQGSPYFQTDESVLGSLLAFDPAALRVAPDYKADGRADPTRYFAHLAFNPKPWVMWNARTVRWADEIFATVDWLVARGLVPASEVPRALRRRWFPVFRRLVPLAPWVWRAMKAARRLRR